MGDHDSHISKQPEEKVTNGNWWIQCTAGLKPDINMSLCLA